ncbi:MAG: hypothetical protein WD738_11250 [Pirellulales bacterium]
MPSFTTIYRAIVMVAAGVIVVKGWQLYGPTTEQLKSAGVRTIELASAVWNQTQPAEASGSAADPRLTAPAKPAAATAPTGVIEPAPLMSPAAGNVDNLPGGASGLATTEPRVDELVKATSAAADDAGVSDRLSPLYSRLKELGASDPQLGPWGSSGEMYRFCCRAALADTPAFTRHFEAVAAEPVGAVEQVVAKVEAWRATQRGSALR